MTMDGAPIAPGPLLLVFIALVVATIAADLITR